eukprot:jgi/Mesvir1/4192/Mv08900-RA.1
MFSLLHGLWNFMFKKSEFHVLILGIDKAGKTTLLERVKNIYADTEGLPPDKIVPTVGLNIGRVEAHKAKLVFWDLGGQAGLRSIWDKYYEEAHSVLFVVDSAEAWRFDDTKNALDRVLSSKELVGAPILILANKQDHPDAVKADQVARALELDRVEFRNRPAMVLPVSAYDGRGVDAGVAWLVDAMGRSARTAMLKQKQEAAAPLLD